MNATAQPIPLTTLDQVAYLIRPFVNQQMYTVMHCRGRLDADRLARAARLMFDAEPVLGCRFVERRRQPVFEPRADLAQLDVFSHIDTADLDADLLRLMTRPVEINHDPLFNVHLFRQPDGNDTVVFHVDHVTVDGSGAKALTYRLVEIYNRLGDNPTYQPEPNRQPRPTLWHIMRRFSLRDNWVARLNYRLPDPTGGIPSTGAATFGNPRYNISRIDSDRFTRIKAYGKAHGATINDLIVTAYFRAMCDLVTPPPGQPQIIDVPFDLRRHLPPDRADAIGNLSVWLYPALDHRPGEAFDDTLTRLSSQTNALKTDRSTLGSAVFVQIAALPGYDVVKTFFQRNQRQQLETGKAHLGLSNIGIFDEARLTFTGVETTAAYLAGPLTNAPSLVMLFTTYRDTLTIIAGYYGDSVKDDAITRVMSGMMAELPD